MLIFDNTVMLRLIEIKNQILCAINAEKFRDVPLCGIMDDYFGALLFFYHYGKTMRDYQVLAEADKLAASVIDRLDDLKSCSYCDGWAGVLSYFNFLKNKKLLDVELSDVTPVIERNILYYTEYCLHNHIYEFLYGVSGVSYYWMHQNNYRIINQILHELYNHKEFDCSSGGYKWKMQGIDLSEAPDYNLSMSHGLVGMLLFLLRVAQKYENPLAKDMLVNGVKYLLSQCNEEKSAISLFPSIAEKDKAKNSRLGWCYGDLGCAYLLYEVGLFCKNNEWIDCSIDIYRHASYRRDVNDSFVIDAGLCHGSSGVYMMFRDLSIKRPDLRFSLEMCDFWLGKTLELVKKNYVYSNGDLLANNEKHIDFSLITGISGIGIMLLSYIDISVFDAYKYIFLK